MDEKKKRVALILALRPGSKGEEKMGEPAKHEAVENEGGETEMSHDDKLHGIASELIAAVKQGDTAATVEALRAAFLCLDSEPHVEGEHIEETPEEGVEESGESEESYSHEAGEKYGGYAKGGYAQPSKVGKRSMAQAILRSMK